MNTTLVRSVGVIMGALAVSLAGQKEAVAGWPNTSIGSSDHQYIMRAVTHPLFDKPDSLPFLPGQINDSAQVMLYDPNTSETVLWHPNQDPQWISGIKGFDLNDEGQISGSNCAWSACWSVYSSGMIWSPNSPMVKVELSPGKTEFEGINNLGIVAGTRSGNRAFLWDQARGVISIPTLLWPNHGNGMATAINNNNQVVGESNGYAFIWGEQTGIRNLGDLPGGDSKSKALDVNDSGQVVGYSAIGDNTWGVIGDNAAFFWTAEDGMVNLNGNQNHKTSFANAINDSGQVVGNFLAENADSFRGFLWEKTKGMQDLNSLTPSYLRDNIAEGVKITAAHDINDRGQILVSGQANGKLTYFYLTKYIPSSSGGSGSGTASDPLCIYPYYPYWYKKYPYEMYLHYYRTYC